MSKWPFRRVSADKLKDLSLADKIHRATLRALDKRDLLVQQTPEWQTLRERARMLRMETLNRHAELLSEFKRILLDRGVSVTVADTAEEATRRITELVMEAGGHVTKSKSMASEEIHLNQALEAAGAQVTETDLGELIVQLAGQAPSHVTAPAIHLSVEDVARIFEARLNIPAPKWVHASERVEESVRTKLAKEMSLHARKVLRERFLKADVGISGANFLVADSATIVVIENEGNIQLTTCLPKRHIVLAGIDKLIARDDDLSVLLRLLPASATAQRQTCYVSLFADKHPDMHVVLLDHGRSSLIDDSEQRDILTCIRCGACMNACPVYRNVGGHAYGGAYPGPIGALLMPHLEGYDRFSDLPFASSLCGACTEICPVGIPIHHRLLQLRSRLAQRGFVRDLGHTLRAASTIMADEKLMQRAAGMYSLARPFAPLTPAGRAWTSSRDLPRPPAETFRSWYARERVTQSTQRKVAPRQPDLSSAPTPSLAASPSQRNVTPRQPDMPLAPTPSLAASPSPETDLLQKFAKRIRELGPEGEAELHAFETGDGLIAFLRNELCKEDPKDVLVEGQRSEKREYKVGVSRAVLLIADTGGAVLDLRQRIRGRAATLAETHYIVAVRADLVRDFATAIRTRSEKRTIGEWGDYQVIVTGPSRTADIEKVLVIPAHGPKRLVVLVANEGRVDLSSLSSAQA